VDPLRPFTRTWSVVCSKPNFKLRADQSSLNFRLIEKLYHTITKRYEVLGIENVLNLLQGPNKGGNTWLRKCYCNLFLVTDHLHSDYHNNFFINSLADGIRIVTHLQRSLQTTAISIIRNISCRSQRYSCAQLTKDHTIKTYGEWRYSSTYSYSRY
jgi:hypothetical protein